MNTPLKQTIQDFNSEEASGKYYDEASVTSCFVLCYFGWLLFKIGRIGIYSGVIADWCVFKDLAKRGPISDLHFNRIFLFIRLFCRGMGRCDRILRLLATTSRSARRAWEIKLEMSAKIYRHPRIHLGLAIYQSLRKSVSVFRRQTDQVHGHKPRNQEPKSCCFTKHIIWCYPAFVLTEKDQGKWPGRPHYMEDQRSSWHYSNQSCMWSILYLSSLWSSFV